MQDGDKVSAEASNDPNANLMQALGVQGHCPTEPILRLEAPQLQTS